MPRNTGLQHNSTAAKLSPCAPIPSIETSSIADEPPPENALSPSITQRDDALSNSTPDTEVEARPPGPRRPSYDPSDHPMINIIAAAEDLPIVRILTFLSLASFAIAGFLTVLHLVLMRVIAQAPFDTSTPKAAIMSYLDGVLVQFFVAFVEFIMLVLLVYSLFSVFWSWRHGYWRPFSEAMILLLVSGGFSLYHLSIWIESGYSDNWTPVTSICPPVLIWDSSWLPASQIGALPQTFRACETRVAPQQAPLFTESIYWNQHPNLYHFFPNETVHNIKFNEEQFLATRHNSTLCYPGKEAKDLEAKGFQANEDLYGQGVRVGIYLNWIASLLANQLLAPKKRRAIQKTYLLTFNTILCIATYFEILRPCVFGIEIEVLYWAYWGGAVCVFSSAPNENRLGDNARWTQLDWITAVRFISNGLMAHHGFWFTWYGYENSYARMPCGTHHFISGRLLDPSPAFCVVRQAVMVIMSVLVMPVAIGLPLVSLLLASEIRVYVLQTFTYYNNDSEGTLHSLEGTGQNRTVQTSRPFRRLRLLGLLRWCKRWHGRMRGIFALPFHAQPGIRLITPLDVKNRIKYRICCAGLWLASFILSVTGIEATLRWNNVDNIDSFNSTGQYLALPLGLFAVMDVVAKLWQQEKERRRQLRCRQVVGEELELADFTVRGALQHAASQPDIEFHMSGGLGDPSLTSIASPE